MDIKNYKKYISLIESEMVPALGCTDPIGIAFCASSAAGPLNGEILSVDAFFSKNLIKNVAAVKIPKTGGMCGARIATALGVIGGNPELKLEALKNLNNDDIQSAVKLEKSDRLQVNIADNDITLYMKVTVTTSDGTSTAIVQDDYTNLVSLVVNGAETINDNSCSESDALSNVYQSLSLETILDFADTVPLTELNHIAKAISMNTALAQEGIKGSNGTVIAHLLQSGGAFGDAASSAAASSVLWTSAAIDARMCGCPLPAMSNTGSGNQGIVSTMPLYGAAQVFDTDRETLVRGTAVSCLTAIYIKHNVGNLSTVCGLTVAGTGAACGLAYIRGGRREALVCVLKNMYGNISGMICDGAKTSCALKAASCVYAACMASDFALQGFGLESNNGIVGKDENDTIDYFVRTSNEGLSAMDAVILDIIMNK